MPPFDADIHVHVTQQRRTAAPRSRAVWADRVARWVASGLTARDFAEPGRFNPRTLAWWSSHLRREAARTAEPLPRTAPPMPRTAPPAPRTAPPAPPTTLWTPYDLRLLSNALDRASAEHARAASDALADAQLDAATYHRRRADDYAALARKARCT